MLEALAKEVGAQCILASCLLFHPYSMSAVPQATKQSVHLALRMHLVWKSHAIVAVKHCTALTDSSTSRPPRGPGPTAAPLPPQLSPCAHDTSAPVTGKYDIKSNASLFDALRTYVVKPKTCTEGGKALLARTPGLLNTGHRQRCGTAIPVQAMQVQRLAAKGSTSAVQRNQPPQPHQRARSHCNHPQNHPLHPPPQPPKSARTYCNHPLQQPTTTTHHYNPSQQPTASTSGGKDSPQAPSSQVRPLPAPRPEWQAGRPPLPRTCPACGFATCRAAPPQRTGCLPQYRAWAARSRLDQAIVVMLQPASLSMTPLHPPAPFTAQLYPPPPE